MDYILGVAVSLVVEVIKKKGGLNSLGSMMALLILSVAVGAGYIYLQGTASWPVIAQILVVAAGFHNLVVRRFPAK